MNSLDAPRFWAKVDRGDGDGCWPWTGGRERNGYGSFWDTSRRVMTRAHRASLLISGQEIPAGSVVRHTCDNPPCVNPAHLIVGTQKDNVGDCLGRDRFPDRAGTQNGRAKLSPDDVAAIRSGYLGRYGEKSEIARCYGVSTAQVSKIILGQTWAT